MEATTVTTLSEFYTIVATAHANQSYPSINIDDCRCDKRRKGNNTTVRFKGVYLTFNHSVLPTDVLNHLRIDWASLDSLMNHFGTFYPTLHRIAAIDDFISPVVLSSHPQPITRIEPSNNRYKPACLLAEAIEFVLFRRNLSRTTKIDFGKGYAIKGKRVLYLWFRPEGVREGGIRIQQDLVEVDNIVNGEIEYKDRFFPPAEGNNEGGHPDYFPALTTIAVGKDLINWLLDTIPVREELSLTTLTDRLPSLRQIANDDVLDHLETAKI